jgi:molybdenum cofactor cytidylyltransferase
MGSPKALLEAGGETFVDRLIGVFAGRCEPVIVVLGYHAEAVRAGMLRAGEAELVVNTHPEDGQLSSLQCGFASVPDNAEAVIFTPVDCPGFRPETVTKLIDAFRRTGARAVVPVYRGRRGHPVLCSRELAAEISALPPGSRARDSVHMPGTLYLEAGDPGVVRDIDDPAAYREFLASGILP